RRPHAPLTPWTLIAPTGSSIFTRSKKNTLTTTSTPATAPMMNAPTGETNAHGDVMATRPASMLLHIIDGSGFPWKYHMYMMPATVADMPAIIVLAATI